MREAGDCRGVRGWGLIVVQEILSFLAQGRPVGSGFESFIVDEMAGGSVG